MFASLILLCVAVLIMCIVVERKPFTWFAFFLTLLALLTLVLDRWPLFR